MPKIKQLRKSQNLNAMELAEKAGLDLNQPLMSAVESGKVLFTPNDLQTVCEALQCTPMDLYDSADDFDLMLVQFRMTTMSDVNSRSKKPTRFDELPEPNPKRQFRMSDEDWQALQRELKAMGFNSLGKFLKSLAHNQKVCKQA